MIDIELIRCFSSKYIRDLSSKNMSTYETVLEYLYAKEMVEGIEHAHAVMHELDADEIQYIVEEKVKDKGDVQTKVDPSKVKRLNMMKRQILQKKVQAVRQGAGADVTASYEPEGELVEGDVHSGQGEKIQKRTKAWMDKKGQKGAPGLDAMKARTAEHKAKRGVKEELSRRSKPSAKAKMAKLDAVLKRREERKVTEKEALKTEGWLGKKKEEKKPQKAMDAGARAKRKLQRKEYAAKVSGSEDNVPDEMREGVGRAIGNAAKGAAKSAAKATGYAAKVGAGIVGAGVQAMSNPELKPNAAKMAKQTSSSSSSSNNSALAARSQAEKAKKSKLDARKKAIQKIKDDRRERATTIMTAEKAAKKVKKEGEDKKFKADSEKPIVAEFVNNLWEASHKCKKCGKIYTGKSCSCGC